MHTSSGLEDDTLDLDMDLSTDPRLAAAVEDAETRFELVAELVRRRKAAGLTQKQVASEMETTQSFVSDFENGHTDPHLSTFQRYTRAVASRLSVKAESPAEGDRVQWSIGSARGQITATGRAVSAAPVVRKSVDATLHARAASSRRTDFALSA